MWELGLFEIMHNKQISDQLKEKVSEINKILEYANENKLEVRFIQQWHPAQNSIGLPVNPPLSAKIIEKIEY